MKKVYLFFSFLFFAIQIMRAQNVGIGTLTPTYKLTVQTPKAAGSWGLMHSDSIVQVGDYISSTGIAEFGTRSAHPLWLIAGNNDSPFPAIAIDAAGINVGLGTTAPANHFQIGGTPGFSGNDIAIGNGTQAMSFFQSGTTSTWYSNNNFALMPFGSNGLVGIGTATPAYNLDILGANPQINLKASSNGSTATLSRYSNRFEISPTDAFQISVGGIGLQHFWVGSNGNVGIGTVSPASNLQVGSVGSTGYAGHHIAFGNGTQASGILQTNTVAEWNSTTDIALMPKGNGHGRVGINTVTPGYPLEVADYVANFQDLFTYMNNNHPGTVSDGEITPNVSILAAQNVLAIEFDAASDMRIKDIQGISNTAKDFEILNTIQVTDYTLKDKIKNGNRSFKKVIAQQVESVYPQVISRHVDFIPNVYRSVTKIEKTEKGYLLHFDSPHHISKDARRIKLVVSGDNTMNKYNIMSIPSDNEVEIASGKLNGDKIFVYGEEVNDFRTVDYEGLTTLNISATQELGKMMKQQRATIKEQDEKIAALTAKVQTIMDELEKLTHK
jgi:hypothetical protein